MRPAYVLACLSLSLLACNPYRSDGVSMTHPSLRPPAPAIEPLGVPPPIVGPETVSGPTTSASQPSLPPVATPQQSDVPAIATVADEPETEEGWQGLRWGMSRADIRSILPAATEIKELVGRTEKAAFGLDSYALPGCTARAIMDFTPSGGLQSVRVQSKGNVDAACIQSIRNGIADKYGMPAHEERPKGSIDIHNAVWRTPGTVISLVSSIDGKGRGLFQIAYANPTAGATPAGANAASTDQKAKL